LFKQLHEHKPPGTNKKERKMASTNPTLAALNQLMDNASSPQSIAILTILKTFGDLTGFERIRCGFHRGKPLFAARTMAQPNWAMVSRRNKSVQTQEFRSSVTFLAFLCAHHEEDAAEAMRALRDANPDLFAHLVETISDVRAATASMSSSAAETVTPSPDDWKVIHDLLVAILLLDLAS